MQLNQSPDHCQAVSLPAFVLIAVISIALVSTGAGCAQQQPAIDKERMERIAATSGEREIIRSIDFTGNNAYKSKTLEKKLGFKRGDYIDPVLAEAYRTTLIEFYRNNGFPFVEVLLDSDKLNRGEVFYAINEGPRIKIGTIKFSRNKQIKTRSLTKVVTTKTRKWRDRT